MAPRLLNYRGVTRGGYLATGSEFAEPSDFTEQKFRQRWKRLVVESEGRQIAGIEGVGRGRTWWSEHRGAERRKGRAATRTARRQGLR